MTIRIIKTAAIACVLQAPVWAASTGILWENTATSVSNSITGPVALSVGTVGLAGTAWQYLHHKGDMSEIGQAGMRASFLLSIGCFAGGLIKTIVPSASGACI